MRADLHIHSYFSDGELSPEQIADECKEKKLDVFSLTDHDTLDGTERARAQAEKIGIGFLSGVELSTHGDWEIHVLGYRTENNGKLKSLCADIAKKRIERTERMILRLEECFGLKVELSDVLAESGMGCAVCRVHLARAILSKGYVSSVREAFSRYIGLKSPAFVRTHEITSVEAVEVLRQGGSIPVLAHPSQIHAPEPQLRRILSELKEHGLEGIEARYSTHNSYEAAYYEELAKEFGLFVTAGNDFHGGYRRNKIGEPWFELDGRARKRLEI